MHLEPQSIWSRDLIYESDIASRLCARGNATSSRVFGKKEFTSALRTVIRGLGPHSCNGLNSGHGSNPAFLAASQIKQQHIIVSASAANFIRISESLLNEFFQIRNIKVFGNQPVPLAFGGSDGEHKGHENFKFHCLPYWFRSAVTVPRTRL